MSNERAETKDLASTHPELVQSMVKSWAEWYKSVSKGNESDSVDSEKEENEAKIDKKDKKGKGSRKQKTE